MRLRTQAFLPVRAFLLALTLAMLIGWRPPAAMAASEPAALPREVLSVVFPGADRIGPFAGQPPAASVYRDGQVAGYVFSTLATVGTVGYSGKPIDILAGVDLDGVVTGAFLWSHNEPILVIGVSHEDLANYVGGFTGIDLGRRVDVEEGRPAAVGFPDAIAGATVSSAVVVVPDRRKR